MRKLSDLIGGLREVKSPYSKLISEENITELVFIDLIKQFLQKRYGDMWFEGRVNLWEHVSPHFSSGETLKRYEHPLQPDIDLLYCQVVNNDLVGPLVGVEVKLFHAKTGWRKVIPKSGWTGFYAGLDEALALATHGLDFVYLWHVFIYPRQLWVRFEKQHNEEYSIKASQEHTEFLTAYSELVSGMIEKFRIPIGYVATSLEINHDDECFRLYTMKVEDPKANSYILKPASHKVRKLILGSLGIKDSLNTKSLQQL